jgi:hypothetical protein
MRKEGQLGAIFIATGLTEVDIVRLTASVNPRLTEAVALSRPCTVSQLS